MTFRSAGAVCVGVLVSAAAGCGNDALPDGITGSFTRQEAEIGGAGTHTLELNVNATGMTVTGPATGGAVKLGVTPGSALFKKIKCSDDASCRFTTESACEGTLSRDATGAVVLVAVGDCESWSGKWTPAGAGSGAGSASATATATASAVTTSEPAAVQPGGIPSAPGTATASAQPTATATSTPTATGTATATGTGTAAPTATATSTASPTGVPALNVTCFAKCQETSMACVRECKVGDLECMKACSAKMTTCAQKCP